MSDKTYKHAALLNRLDDMQRVNYLKSYHGFIRQAELVITQLEDEVREMTRAVEDKPGEVPTPVELIAWARACRKQGFHTNLGHIADALEAAITPNQASVIGIKVTEIEAEDQQWLSDNPNTSDIVEWIKTYARNEVAIALAKQSCNHQFHYFGMQEIRRCSKCNAFEATS